MTLLWAWKVQLWPADVPRRLVALLHVSFRKKFPEVDLRYGSTHYGVAAELSLSLSSTRRSPSYRTRFVPLSRVACGGSTTRETVAMAHEEAEVPPVSRPSSRTLDLERWKYHQGLKRIPGSTQRDARKRE